MKVGFYYTPLKKTPVDPRKPEFTCTPIGWNKLDEFVQDMCEEASIGGKATTV